MGVITSHETWPAVLMVWPRVQETKEIFGLSLCTMVANNRETHLRAVHYHLLVQHYKSHTLKAINLAILPNMRACFMAGHQTGLQVFTEEHKAVILMCTEWALIDVLLISVKLYVGFHQANYIASKIENVIDLLRLKMDCLINITLFYFRKTL